MGLDDDTKRRLQKVLDCNTALTVFAEGTHKLPEKKRRELENLYSQHIIWNDCGAAWEVISTLRMSDRYSEYKLEVLKSGAPMEIAEVRPFAR